jgi:hypothetical protein
MPSIVVNFFHVSDLHLGHIFQSLLLSENNTYTRYIETVRNLHHNSIHQVAAFTSNSSSSDKKVFEYLLHVLLGEDCVMCQTLDEV